MRQLALEAGRKVAAEAAATRKEQKHDAARAAIETDVRFTAARTESMHEAEARARADLRAARFVELRRSGMKSEDCFAQVEKEFGE